jgi:two-component system nitrate/nitrite sensor histidine kinase NarX
MNWNPFHNNPRVSVESTWLRDPLVVGGTLKLLSVLAIIFLSAAVTIALLYFYPGLKFYVLVTQVVLLLVGLYVILVLVRRVYREVIKPIDSVRTWAARMREGDYSAELSVPIQGEFAMLMQDLSEMGRWYKDIALEGDDRFSEQVRQMARKTRLLEILYDIAATISVSRDLEEVLSHFLQLSADITHARVALVRLATNDGDMLLVDVVGEDKDKFKHRVPMAEAIPGQHTRVKSVYVTAPETSVDFAGCSNEAGSLECVIIPLIHQGDVMGSYHMLIDQSVSSLSYDLHELFTSIGYHLGMAIHKSHLDNEANKQTIFRERLTLAHELHDSLAQSMVSLRFQCKALDDSLSKQNLQSASKDVEKLRSGVDKANVELRELLAHFRAPIDERGLVPALTDMLKTFREENQILVFSQFDCEDPRPPMHIQRQVIRIAQEALANVKKHAGARIVRLLLRVSESGQCYLLIEDDGHGFEGETIGHAGEHVGLKVMHERAAHIDAKLDIESEPDEGTRVELRFKIPAKVS